MTKYKNYINPRDLAKEVRAIVKKRYPQYKFSVTSDHNEITLGLVKSDLFEDGARKEVNHHSIKNNPVRYFEGEPHQDEKVKLFCELLEIVGREQYITDDNPDYGKIPNYYITLMVGSHNKKHEAS